MKPEEITLHDGRTLSQAIQEHNEWLESARTKGKQLVLQNENLENADLHEMCLQKVIIKCCNLKGVNLSKADLTESEIQVADMGLVQGKGCKFNKAKLTQITTKFANFSSANFDGAVLTDVQIIGTDLFDALMRGIIMYRGCIQQTRLNYANMSYAELYQTRVEKVNFCFTKKFQACWFSSVEASIENESQAKKAKVFFDLIFMTGESDPSKIQPKLETFEEKERARLFNWLDGKKVFSFKPGEEEYPIEAHIIGKQYSE